MDITALQNMDPFVFEQMQPYVSEAVFNYGAGRNPTEADINRMAHDVVRNSRFHMHPPPHYNQNQLLDVARFLVLMNLYNTYGYNLNPFWQMYFGGIPGFIIPYLIIGQPVFRGIPWRRPVVRPHPPVMQPRPPARPPFRPPSRPRPLPLPNRPQFNRPMPR